MADFNPSVLTSQEPSFESVDTSEDLSCGSFNLLLHVHGSVDTSEDLGCGSRNLLLYESVQPLPGFLDILDHQKVLYQLDCVALSKVTHQRDGIFPRSSVTKLPGHPSERGD